jgi:metal-sulfur cluster biosynthetic enzyme
MTTQEIAHALATVYDPEIGVDIVSLGLVYGIEDCADRVSVVMTTTFDGCPMSAAIADAVGRTLELARPGAGIEITITHHPPWNPGMLSEGARRWLGLA